MVSLVPERHVCGAIAYQRCSPVVTQLAMKIEEERTRRAMSWWMCGWVAVGAGAELTVCEDPR